MKRSKLTAEEKKIRARNAWRRKHGWYTIDAPKPAVPRRTLQTPVLGFIVADSLSPNAYLTKRWVKPDKEKKTPEQRAAARAAKLEKIKALLMEGEEQPKLFEPS
jgi:hypothetical protein